MRNTWRVFTTLAALSIGCILADTPTTLAQASRSNTEPPSAPAPESRPREPLSTGVPEPGLRYISSEMSFSGKVVKHRPYSAETLTESTQMLSNGTRLTRRTTGRVLRDSEGRTRRELSGTTVGPFATSGDTQSLVFINDPVAGISSTFIPNSDTVQTKSLPAANNYALSEPEVNSENRRIESLGKQLIEGFEAEGTRTTILIPTGRIGNDKPLEIVHEQWYSPELQTMLLSKHRDPRWGETIYQLNNIDRNAPDPALFNLPTPSPQRKKPRQRP
ncbi:MAG: hypothetical protein L0220_26755 [Acidobacteria bacterium]|nr:hypothetical protein [Acidobacteriota bacterium]